MDNLSSGCYFAVGEKPPAAPPPEPVPKPPEPPAPIVDRYPQGYGDGYAVGYGAGRHTGELDGRNAQADLVFRSWGPGRELPDDTLPDGARWDLSPWAVEVLPDPDVWLEGRWDLARWFGAQLVGDPWADWPLPLDALYRAQDPAAWSSPTAWAGGVWHG
jgi:hypothetical protein